MPCSDEDNFTPIFFVLYAGRNTGLVRYLGMWEQRRIYAGSAGVGKLRMQKGAVSDNTTCLPPRAMHARSSIHMKCLSTKLLPGNTRKWPSHQPRVNTDQVPTLTKGRRPHVPTGTTPTDRDDAHPPTAWGHPRHGTIMTSLVDS